VPLHAFCCCGRRHARDRWHAAEGELGFAAG
jgi:hypothetical protein